MPTLKDFFTNMSAPMPLYKKLYLVFRNNLIKVVREAELLRSSGRARSEK